MNIHRIYDLAINRLYDMIAYEEERFEKNPNNRLSVSRIENYRNEIKEIEAMYK